MMMTKARHPDWIHWQELPRRIHPLANSILQFSVVILAPFEEVTTMFLPKDKVVLASMFIQLLVYVICSKMPNVKSAGIETDNSSAGSSTVDDDSDASSSESDT